MKGQLVQGTWKGITNVINLCGRLLRIRSVRYSVSWVTSPSSAALPSSYWHTPRSLSNEGSAFQKFALPGMECFPWPTLSILLLMCLLGTCPDLIPKEWSLLLSPLFSLSLSSPPLWSWPQPQTVLLIWELGHGPLSSRDGWCKGLSWHDCIVSQADALWWFESETLLSSHVLSGCFSACGIVMKAGRLQVVEPGKWTQDGWDFEGCVHRGSSSSICLPSGWSDMSKHQPHMSITMDSCPITIFSPPWRTEISLKLWTNRHLFSLWYSVGAFVVAMWAVSYTKNWGWELGPDKCDYVTL